jgi:autotransporter-associated beta strand protein
MVSGNFKRRTGVARRLQAVLLASSALCLASALPAAAQDATWNFAPGSGDYSTATNWTPTAVPTGTAFFGLSGTTALSFSANATVGGWTFNTGASAYSFTTSHFLSFTGDGIVINGGSAAITNSSFLQFFNTSTAGSAAITNNGSIYLHDNSTAGNANIVNNNIVQFIDNSTAGSATIANTGSMYFYDNSKAGSAAITNSGSLTFQDNSTAGGTSASITNTGTVTFIDASTAGSASITNNNTLNFTNTSTAGSAAITNNGQLTFFLDSTAGNATITNTNQLTFFSNTTAGNATIMNSGNVLFDGDSTAGNAQLINTTPGAVINFFTPGPNSDGKISAGSIAGDGRFDLNDEELTVGGNNLSTNVTGVLTGTGTATGNSLIKIGTGTLILSGTNTYTGATEVNGGTLAVNGSIAPSSLTTVNAGAALMGTGTVGNTLVTGGTFAPGSGTPGSSMTVSGTLGFNAASTYLVNVNPTTSSFANVSGAATLGGATVNAIFANGSYIAKQYTILNAASISGTFGTLTNTNLPATFTDTLSYDATHAYLNLTLAFIAPPTTGLSGNQSNVGNALINYFNTNGGIPLVFGGLTANGLSQASGQPGASTAQSGITGVGQFANAVFDSAFDDSGQGGAAGFAQDDETNSYAAKRKVSREAKNAYAAVTPRDRSAPSFEARWNIWASVYGGNSRVNGDTGAGTNTTTSRIFGTVAGASYRFTPDMQAGFALGGAGSSFDVANGFGGGKADVFNAGVYAKHNIGAAYVAGLLGYSWQDTSTDRTVTIAGTDKLHASFKAQALAARLEGGWRYATPAVGITPYAALQATTFYLPAYGETATSGSNTFALSYASKTVTATRSELGAKFDKAMLVQGGVFTLKAKTAWAHDWNTDRSATATFQALPGATFTVNGAQPSANAALVSLGGEMNWHNGWTVAANFDGEFSRTTAGYAGKGNVKYAW